MDNNFFGNLFSPKKNFWQRNCLVIITRALPSAGIQRVEKLDQHSPYCIDAAIAWESGAD
jgi:hypothetical protein